MLGAAGERGRLMLRNLFALISGLFAMMIVITFCALTSDKLLFPPPEGVDLRQPEAAAAFLHSMPGWALGLILFSWLAGAFAGSYAAARLAGSFKLQIALVPAVLVSVLTLLGSRTVPHPLWMVMAGVVLPPVLALLAVPLAQRAQTQKGLASTK
jgi:hypothetical protein